MNKFYFGVLISALLYVLVGFITSMSSVLWQLVIVGVWGALGGYVFLQWLVKKPMPASVAMLTGAGIVWTAGALTSVYFAYIQPLFA